MSDAPGREHAPNIKATGITECFTERTEGNAAKMILQAAATPGAIDNRSR